MNVYAFFEPIDENWIDHSDYQKIIDLWKKSWSFYGWNPIIYGIDECKKHAQYDVIYKFCEKLPTVNPKKYEMFCYLRWLYMANVGGWYSDVDMINYGFTPIDYKNKIVTTGFALHCSPIYMDNNNYQKLIDSYFNIDESSYVLINNKIHYSDMYILKKFSENIEIKLHLCDQYPDDVKEKHVLAHYPFRSNRHKIIQEDKRSKIFNCEN